MNSIIVAILSLKQSLILAIFLIIGASLTAQVQIGLVSNYQTFAYETEVFATTDYVYISNGSSLEIIDISNINNPVMVGSIILPGEIGGIQVIEDTAYVAAAGLTTVNVSNPSSPWIFGSYISNVETYDLHVVNSYAYVADEDGLKIVDVTDHKDPKVNGSLSYWPAAESIFVDDSLAFVGVLWDAIKVVDITKPFFPAEVGTSNLVGGPYGNTGWATDVHMANGTVYFTDGHYGIYSFILNGYNLDSIGHTEIGYAGGIYADAKYVYVADSDFELIDAADPFNLTSIATHNTQSGSPSNIHVVGNYIFLGIDGFGLTILELLGGTTVIKEPIENVLSVYPNPTNGALAVELEHAKRATLSVFDSFGKTIFQSEYSNVQQGQIEEITLPEIANGMYFVQLQVEGQLYTKKVIKH